MRPNILLLLPDQWRHDFTGLNPELPLNTPTLQRLAGAGTRFLNAICPSPICAPSRASLASGKYYDNCRVLNNQDNYPPDQPTFYKYLRDQAGYHVSGCGKFDLHKPDLNWGRDGSRLLEEWGFSSGIDNEGKWDSIDAYEDNDECVGPYFAFLEQHKLAHVHHKDMLSRRENSYAATFPTQLPEYAYCDNWIGANAKSLLEAIPVGTPWFMQVNFTGPHDPLDITEAMEKQARGRQFPAPVDSNEFSSETQQLIRQNYAVMCENIDRLCGELIDQVKARGELENTIIVFSSDHGEMLGDHSCWGKADYHQPSVGVPLIISGPGVLAGCTQVSPVSLHDLAATFLDYAGCAPLPEMDAISLRTSLENNVPFVREHVYSGLNDWRMVFDGRFKFVWRSDDDPLLFDLENDPEERINVIGNFPRQAEHGFRLIRQYCSEASADKQQSFVQKVCEPVL